MRLDYQKNMQEDKANLLTFLSSLRMSRGFAFID